MYYHLLDGDWASNACSWQWVAGANSSKKYYANQENINKYTNTNQVNTFLDKPYEWFESPDCPAQLMDTQQAYLETILPEAAPLHMDQQLPTFVYNYYNLRSALACRRRGQPHLVAGAGIFQQLSGERTLHGFYDGPEQEHPEYPGICWLL